MSKPEHEELVEASADFLATYIGDVSVDPVIQEADPNIEIENLQELLEYYFLLTGEQIDSPAEDRSNLNLTATDTGGITNRYDEPIGVLDFVSLLPARLRTVDPATRKQIEIFDGEVRGAIDWNKTIEHRWSTGDTVGQRFACRTRQRTVDTAKNRVLIELLSTITEILDRFDTEMAPNDDSKLGWFKPWEVAESRPRRILQTKLNNVYLSQLSTGDTAVDSRDLAAVEQSRDPLYSEAAILLRNYRRIRHGDLNNQEIKNLLRLNLFAPPEDGGTSDLFELYWIFELLDQFDDVQFKQITDERGQIVAAWESDGSEYLLFHDWDGQHHWNDDRGYVDYLDISWDLEEIQASTFGTPSPDGFARRQYAVHEQKHRLSQSVFESSFGRKTPDIVLLKLDADAETYRLEGLFIAEVKWSTGNSYLKEGLEQLLEYGAHAKFGDDLEWAGRLPADYIAADPDILESVDFELGYFVGHSDEIANPSPSGIQISGFGDTPERPFAESDDQSPNGLD
ncbi:hypothetical protein [Halorussus sp. MSC15.2]|uniref:hypothetical protein n=1 Tax=Halorussus sp. MSC15.2 TaxID=2283638 RepID=UPI0013D1B3D8|nr:hypothetical protein [Halorussus sp. MSC15.2]NEU59216.1 hypothetical protein [Halorussus sp. MSC15.2]